MLVSGCSVELPLRDQKHPFLHRVLRDEPVDFDILAAGPDVENVAVGDKVIYRNYAGTRIEWLGKEYLLVKEEDLQAKVTL